MAVIYERTCLAAALIGLTASLSACTVHKAEVPPLTGPSSLGLSLSIATAPDVLPQDGQSTSIVTITAFDSNGQPKANLNLRVDIAVGGVVTDFGRLSAKNAVTDASGRAALIYQAPPAPVVIVGNGTKVDIQVTPLDSNFDNSTSRVASIMLVPPGVVTGPGSLVPSFQPPALNVGDVGVFSAKVVDSSGNDVTNSVASFQWNFGDGGTGSGQSVTHTFTSIGTFKVTLTVTDNIGRTNFVTQSVTVGQGQLPVATFVASPGSPVINQTINFNASGSTAAPGHTITAFTWTFGDGAGGSGPIVTHAYSQAGTYTVTLQVTDDAGRQSGLISQTITVGTGNPVAQITISPPSGPLGTAFSFIGSQSTAAPGRTIVRYDWNFGDNSTGGGATTNHSYSTRGTFTVTLVVTDDQGNTGIATATVTVS
ncbi:MAG TPA: PKD domain-containing protein [Vicinamibacterales bacterium]